MVGTAAVLEVRRRQLPQHRRRRLVVVVAVPRPEIMAREEEEMARQPQTVRAVDDDGDEETHKNTHIYSDHTNETHCGGGGGEREGERMVIK